MRVGMFVAGPWTSHCVCACTCVHVWENSKRERPREKQKKKDIARDLKSVRESLGERDREETPEWSLKEHLWKSSSEKSLGSGISERDTEREILWKRDLETLIEENTKSWYLLQAFIEVERSAASVAACGEQSIHVLELFCLCRVVKIVVDFKTLLSCLAWAWACECAHLFGKLSACPSCLFLFWFSNIHHRSALNLVKYSCVRVGVHARASSIVFRNRLKGCYLYMLIVAVYLCVCARASHL